MLLEVGFVVGFYLGFRLFEYRHQKLANKSVNILERAKSQDSEVIALKKLEVEPRKSPEKSQMQEIEFIKKNEKVEHYLKISVVHLGMATIRQFIYPSIAPLYLGIFIYNNFDLYRSSENALAGNNKYELLATISSLFALATNLYVAIGLGACFYWTGEKIILLTQKHSKKLLTNAFGQLPSVVWCLKNNIEVETSLEEIHINDIVIVTIGDIIPVDGIIKDGTAMIDQHALTGESQPAEKSIGDKVFATTVVIAGKLLVKVEKTGIETTAAKIDQILNHCANFKTRTQLQGMRWAEKTALPFLGGFVLATTVWGLPTGLTVLASYFGTRIKILAPLETFIHLKLASQKGILVKDGRALENLRQVDTILFDKTGTLTNQTLSVLKIILCDDYFDEELLVIYAAAAESKMTHPIAKAIINYAKASNLTLPNIDDSQYQVGYGITVHIENQLVQVGSTRFMKLEGIIFPNQIKRSVSDASAQGHSFVMVAVNHRLIGAIELQSVVRSEVKQLVANLRQHGVKHIAIVSGDLKASTKKLAKELGMDDYFYNILPQEKASIVEQLQTEGKSVCFVGDGINDAIAMKKANVSISLMGASSIATDVAEVVLMDGTLYHLTDLFEIAKQLDMRLQTSLGISLVPSAINLIGAFWFNFGFTNAVIIKNLVFFTCLGYVMLPLIKHEKESVNPNNPNIATSIAKLTNF